MLWFQRMTSNPGAWLMLLLPKYVSDLFVCHCLQNKNYTNSGCALAKAASAAVVNSALAYGSRDNITVLAMLLDWDEEFV